MIYLPSEMAVNQRTHSNSEPNSGYITRIKLHNFVIYDDIEFFPGRNLNLITGANGSGKSTIVCGLSLGLGGKVSNLGRGTCLADFIKMNKDEAYIEIDLYQSETKNVRIKHSFRRGEKKSYWSIDGKTATKHEVEKATSAFNIQVDNLCQFLPQDRVADFAKMNAKDLLLNTEKAINEKLYDTHIDLCQMHNFESNLKKEVNSLSEKLEEANKKVTHWKSEYENLQERKQLLKQLDILRCKKLEIKTHTAKEDLNLMKEECKEHISHLKAVEKSVEPLENSIKTFDTQIKSFEKDIHILEQKLNNKVDKDRNYKNLIENINESVRQAEDDLERAIKEQSDLKTKRQNLKNKIQDLEVIYENSVEESNQAKVALAEVAKETNEIKSKILAIEDQQSGLEPDRRQILCQMKALENELSRNQNLNKQRMDLLRRESRDAYEAAAWLENNRHKFKSNVFLPPAITVQCKNDRMARYVESSIPRRDLVSFMFQNCEDMDEFLSIIRDEKKLVVNAVQTPKRQLHEFKPDIPINELKNFGFISYVNDLFSCPDEVKAYLCQSYGIHNLPVGTEQTHAKVSQVISTFENLRQFFTHDYSYRITRSQYSNNTSTSSNEIRPARLLANACNHKQEEELKRKIEVLKSQLNEISQEYQKLRTQREELNHKMEGLRSKRNDLTKAKDRLNHLEGRLKAFRDQLNGLSDINMDEIRENHDLTLVDCVKRKLSVMSKIKESVGEYSVIILKINRLGAQKCTSRRELELTKSQCEDKLNEKRKLIEIVDNLRKEEKILFDEYRKLSSDLFHKLNDLNISEDELNNLTNDIEEIDTKIAEFEARAELQAREVEDIEKQYEDSIRNLEVTKEYFEKSSSKLENFVSNSKQKRDDWERELKEVIQTISCDFGNLMSYLDCAGEVSLSKPLEECDYENYGICIKVKFRDNEELMELSSKRQSGGERAVSTVLYMLALQKLTSAPFRVVDEINQGMDSTNERKVYELLIKHVCSPSQYFMLTPKLLPDLNYPTNITFFCVQKTIKNFGLPYDSLTNAYNRFLDS
ncbi:DgyrCDS10949 [Dimorphilus gyrociliatus]|uniref:Structural maintenance of chromosomes protein 5 n=1 Tax=Dimorphilus gyrociliatus TaxID=2664684 RepID=A0A7I8W2Z7_9ANNE|nr:DgyrCDS10949 [Dimorphilus gyrociliatus]